jgi:hypothetical protein
MVSRSVASAAALPNFGLICVFGGEVSPSDKGHEGAGDFTNEVICVPTSEGQLAFKPTIVGVAPLERGWLDCHVMSCDENKARIIYFGGLTGDDKNPLRMNDMWALDIVKNQ